MVTDKYQTLLPTAAFVTSGSFSFNITGLTQGQQYVIQLWTSQSTWAASPATLSPTNRVATLSSGTSPTVTLDLNVNDTQGSCGQFVTGTFTADASGTQGFVATGTGISPGGNATRTYVNAVQIRAVPEPSTLAMAALGIGGVWAFVRRRSRLKAEDSASGSVM